MIFWSEWRRFRRFFRFLQEHKFQFSISIFKFKETKKYYLEIWSWKNWKFNNFLSKNNNFDDSKTYLTTKLNDVLQNPFLKSNVNIEKDFILFNNNILKQKFEWTYFDQSQNQKEIEDQIIEEKLQVYLADYFKNLWKDKQLNFKESELQNIIKQKNSFSWINSKEGWILVDELKWDDIYNFIVWNEFIMSYYIQWKDKVVWKEKNWKFDLIAFIDYVNNLEIEKYLLKFSFDFSVNSEVQTFPEHAWKFKLKWEEWVFDFWENFWKFSALTTSLFVFSQKPDLWSLQKKITEEFANLEITNPEDWFECSPFYLQDNSYNWKNYIKKWDIKNFFGLLKKYEYNPNWIVTWREYFSNILTKFYPHEKAWVTEDWLERSAHTWVIWTSGSWKTEYSFNTWKQLWRDWTVWIYIDNIWWLQTRIDNKYPELSYNTFKWWIDWIWEKTSVILEIIWVSKLLDNEKNKIKELREKVRVVKNFAEKNKIEIDLQNSNKKVKNLNLILEKISKHLIPFLNTLRKEKEITFDNIEEFLKSTLVEENGFSKQLLNGILKNLEKNKIKKFKDKLSAEFKEVNIIWRMWLLKSRWEDEVNQKTEMLTLIMWIDNIENPTTRDLLKTIISWYLNNLKDWDFFNWNNFEKAYSKEINELDIDEITKRTSLWKVEIWNNFKALMNSKIDFIDMMNENDLIVLDISSLSNNTEQNKKMQFLFFTMLRFYMVLNKYKEPENRKIIYTFLEEFHNYIPKNPQNKIEVILWSLLEKMIAEVRNYSVIMYLISQKYEHFKLSWVVTNISQLIIFDTENVKNFWEDNKFKDDLIYKKYMKDYIDLFKKVDLKPQEDPNSRFRLWFFYNQISSKSECFINKVYLKDMNILWLKK